MTAVDPTLTARLREAAADFPAQPGNRDYLHAGLRAIVRLTRIAAHTSEDDPYLSEWMDLAAAFLTEHHGDQMAALVASKPAAEPAAPAELVDEPGPQVVAVYDKEGDPWTRRGAAGWQIDGLEREDEVVLTWAELRDEYGPLTLTPPAKGGEPK